MRGPTVFIIPALKLVFGSKLLALAVLGIAAVFFMLAVYLPNLRLIAQVVFSNRIAVGTKIGFLVSLLGSIQTNFSLFSAAITVLVALLFGMNVAMFLYYLKQRRTVFVGGGTATGIGGLIAGILGVGCAACSSVLLTSLLATLGASGLLALLPFGGGEFGIAGIFLLLISISSIAKKIQDPLICEPPHQDK